MKEEKIVVDVSLPEGWKDLSQSQLRFFFRMMNDCDSMEEAITRCFLAWGGVKVVGRASGSDEFILRKDKAFFSLTSQDLWQWMSHLRWMENPPLVPMVILRFGRRHRAIDPLFKGVPFGTYLACVANWSDMMRSGKMDDARMSELCFSLYGCRPKRIPPEYVGCIVYWMASLQEYFSKRFKDLFSPVASSDGQGSLGGGSQSFQDSVNAMIRALTKGDVLKEKEVLEIDTWRALIELDAQAKESRQINDSIKRS